MKKIAIIEIAACQIKLKFAHILDGGYYFIYDEISDPIKVGEDINKDGFLKPGRITEVLDILKGYKKLCTAYGISDVQCYTTFAVRMAKNQKSFIDEVSAIIGFKAKVLSENEELNAIYTSVINSLEVPKGLIVQIGSESTEIVLYVRRNILLQKVIPLGANTLSRTFENESPAKQADFAYAKFAKALAEIPELKEVEPEFQVVGVGSFYEALVKISKGATKYPFDMLHNHVMSGREIEQAYTFLKGLELDKKKKLRGISETSADVISVAVAMAKAAQDAIGLDQMVFCANGTAEGILLNIANPSTLEKPITDILGYSLEAQNRYFEKSRTNSEAVYNIAMILFKQLRVLHKLSRTYVKVLRIASYMHDAGMRIDFKGHEKNALPIILNTNLFGASHREIVLAGLVASSQNAADFSIVDFTRYRELFIEEDLEAIKKLAVIVKIAEGLDRCGLNLVKDISCDILGDSVILKAIVEADASFEIKEAMQAATDFKKAYGKNLEIL